MFNKCPSEGLKIAWKIQDRKMGSLGSLYLNFQDVFRKIMQRLTRWLSLQERWLADLHVLRRLLRLRW